jgi:hypothetical protein
MLRFTLSVSFLFLCLQVAQATVKDFAYLPVSKAMTAQTKMHLLATMATHFESETYSIPQPFFMDTVQSSVKQNKTVMMKFGYAVSDPSLLKTLTELSKGFLYHTVSASGDPYTMYFEGFSVSEVRDLLQSYHVSLNERPKALVLLAKFTKLLIPSAHAGEECPPKMNEFIPSWLRKAGTQASSCLIRAFKGAWNTTGGAVAGLAKAIAHPIESGIAVWNGASKFWEGIKAFQKDVKGAMAKLSIAYDQLPEGAATQIICEVVSTLGTAALINYFTVGGGSPGTMLAIANVLAKFENLPKAAKWSQRLMVAANGGAPLTKVGEISAMLARSKTILFMKENVLRKMTPQSLTPGKSYTIIINNGKLVIGEDIVTEFGGTAKTHVMMMAALKAKNQYDYRGLGGAIKVHPNGVIDVSGYHLQNPSHAAAAGIRDLLKEQLPDLQVRSTPGRLSELPPLND